MRKLDWAIDRRFVSRPLSGGRHTVEWDMRCDATPDAYVAMMGGKRTPYAATETRACVIDEPTEIVMQAWLQAQGVMHINPLPRSEP